MSTQDFLANRFDGFKKQRKINVFFIDQVLYFKRSPP